ncbi:MAG: MFS transporter [Methanophagales archaeon ANME-1-THS]|nr:MAG: MFS transporter [Methanophagales archaeon ANME-1-THS]
MELDREQLRTRIVITAALSVFSTQFGVTVIAPLLGMWVETSGAPFFTAALIFSAFTIVCLPLGIPGGILSDKLGRKPLIVAGLALYASASLLFPFSTEPSGWIAVRALQGAGAGLFFPAITALLSEVTRYEKRGEAMSVYNIGLGAGLAVGPASGGILFDRYGIFTPFLVCAASALLSIMLVLLLVHEPEVRARRTGAKVLLPGRERKALTRASLIIFFGIGVAAIMGALFSPFAFAPLKLSAGIIGTILSTMFIVFAFVQAGFNRLMQQIGELILSNVGLFLCACGLLVLYFATTLVELFIMSIFLGAGLGAVSLGTLTLASKAAGEGVEERERRGKVMGIYYTVFYAGLGGIPLVCGALSEIFGARVLFLAYAVLLLIVMGVVWQFGRA